MHPVHIDFLPVHKNEKISPSIMAEDIFSSYGAAMWAHGVAQSVTKHQTLLECVLTGNSKLYLGKAYTEEQLKKLSEEEVDKLFNNYEAKLSGKMVKSLGKSIINMYSVGACAALGISDQDALSEDFEIDLFLNSALQRYTCELYYKFSSFLAPLSIGIITSRHYLSEHNKNEKRRATFLRSQKKIVCTLQLTHFSSKYSPSFPIP